MTTSPTTTILDRVEAALSYLDAPAVVFGIVDPAAALRLVRGVLSGEVLRGDPAAQREGDVLAAVVTERRAQDRKWGEQNHPDGTGGDAGRYLADVLRSYCDDEHHSGNGTWASILAEEVGEAFGEADAARLRAELVQVAAVAVQWVAAIDRRPAPRPARRVIVGGHTAHVCTCHETGCQFCDGGLFACTVCGAFEGATPDDCPGERMTPDQSDAVYAGRLNYRAGEWRDECCQVMRHAYDLDAYMSEEGYVRQLDPAHPSGFRWVEAAAEVLHPDQVAQRAAAHRRGLHATEQALLDARAEAEGAQASGTAARDELARLRPIVAAAEDWAANAARREDLLTGTELALYRAVREATR